MKIEPQKLFIAVSPQGKMCGPCMAEKELVEKSLTEGLRRTLELYALVNGIEQLSTWQELGYRVIPCLVTPLED
jgi:hypothetical protein